MLELGWRDVAQVFVQPRGVVPVDPRQGGQLDILDAPPGTLARATHDLGLVQAVDALGQGAIERVAHRADGGDGTELCQLLAIADARVLGEFNRSSQRQLAAPTVGDR